MTKISASEAKTHFGALLDQAQKEPVTIDKQGRPVAVVVSFQSYSEQQKAFPSEDEKKRAVEFLKKWAQRPVSSDPDAALKGDLKAQAIWDKYTRTA